VRTLTATAFNNEHVIPDWVLTLFDLHGRRITLPDERGVRYGQYTVPCCEACNAQMSRIFEKPISNLVKAGYAAVVEHLYQDGPWLLFSTMMKNGDIMWTTSEGGNLKLFRLLAPQ
jgi:hypothetical protein